MATNNSNSPNTDEAALIGASLAAIITLAIAEGAWTIFDSIIGLSLFAVLVAYFDFRGALDPDEMALPRAMAFAAVLGLTLTLVVAWPEQWVLAAESDLGKDCDAVLGAAFDDYEPVNFRDPALISILIHGWAPSDTIVSSRTSYEQRDRLDGCVAGNTTTSVLPLVWLSSVLIVPSIRVIRAKRAVV